MGQGNAGLLPFGCSSRKRTSKPISNPELQTAELARCSGFEEEWPQLNLRKLKNLGLTEGLEANSQLSPRSQTFVKALERV